MANRRLGFCGGLGLGNLTAFAGERRLPGGAPVVEAICLQLPE